MSRTIFNIQIKIFVFSIFSFCFLKNSNAQCVWSSMGPNDFDQLSYYTAWNSSMNIDLNGIPFVAYRDGLNGNKGIVKKYIGNKWVSVGSAFSPSLAGSPDLLVDATGTPYVIFGDATQSFRASVMKYNGTSWINVGLPGFSAGSILFPKIVVDGSGILYVVFKDNGYGDHAVVMKFNGTSWVNAGPQSISSGEASFIDIAIDQSGVPYVVYYDDAYSYKAVVKKYNGTSWINVGTPGISVGNSPYTSITINSSGVPYIAYCDVGINDKVVVKTFNGSNWVTVGPAGLSTGPATFTDIKIDASDIPHVVYRNSGGANSVKKYNGASWVDVGPPNSLGGGDYNAIHFDPSGTPYIAWSDGLNGTKASVMKYNGTNWEFIGTNGISEKGFDIMDMALNGAGTPYLAYMDYAYGGGSSILKYNGMNWVYVGAPGLSGNPVGNISIKIDGVTPYLACTDVNAGSKVILLKYNGSTWAPVNWPSPISPGYATGVSLAIHNGTPYVAYSDNTNNDKVTVRQFNGASWTTIGLACFSAGQALNNSLAIDPMGTPYVAYGDVANNNKIAVMKYNGASWVNVGTPGFSPNNIYNVKLVIDAGGVPYISFADPALNYKAFVMMFNGTAWVNVGSGPASIGSGNAADIVLDATGSPYLSYADSASGNMIVRKYNGTSWITVGSSGFSAGPPGLSRIQIDPNGNPIVAYGSITGLYAKKLDVGGIASVSPNLICQGATVTFSASGGTSYNWTGPNSFFSTASSPTLSNINLSQGGTYTVVISNSVCPASTILLSVPVNTIPSIGVNSGSVCSGNSFTINPTGANTYTISGGNTIVSPIITSTYNITGTSLQGCASSNTAISTVTVNSFALPNLTVSGGAICNGQNFTITPSGASTYTYSSGNAIVSPTANTSYSVTGTSSLGCISSTPAICNVTVNTTPTLTVNSGTICAGDTFTILPGGANTYTFSNGNIVTPNTTTNYTISGTNTVGCTSIIVNTVNVNSLPTISVTSGAICVGDSYTIIPSGANTYTFNSGNAIVTPTSTSSYSVTGTSSLGCISSNTAVSSVTVNTLPVIMVNSGAICNGQSFTITPSGANTYTYSSGNSIVTPTTNTTFSVTGTNSLGCISSNAAISSITVYALPLISVNSGSICSSESFTIIPTGAITYTVSGGLTIVNPTITTNYTISGTDINNCTNTQITSVQVNTACVWPGDANSDGICNNVDVLELGLHYTSTGPARINASNFWQPYDAANWTGTISNNKNLNHSDCDGDGIIDQNDTLAIYNNYNFTHPFKQSNSNTFNSQLTITPDQNLLFNGQWGTSSIFLGDSLNAIANINGIAYTINFDNTLIEQDSLWLEYPSSFLNLNNLNFRKTDFTNSALYTATTHTNNINVTGNGKIALLHYKISAALTSTSVLNIALSNAHKSESTGLITPITVGATTVMIGTDVGIKENVFGNNFSIIPNPTSGDLIISMNRFVTSDKNIHIEIINSLGQKVVSSKVEFVNSNIQFDISDLKSGVYFLQIFDNQNLIGVKKVIKE